MGLSQHACPALLCSPPDKHTAQRAAPEVQEMALQDTVQQAAAFNRSLTRRAEAARVISPAAAVQEPLSSSAATAVSFSSEQPGQQQAGSGAEPDQAGAPAPHKEQLPATLSPVQAEQEAALPESDAHGHAGESALHTEDTEESRPAADAEASGEAIQVPSSLEAGEEHHLLASEPVRVAASVSEGEQDQTSSSEMRSGTQKQFEIESAEQGTHSKSEERRAANSVGAQAPEQASTPAAALGLTQDAPQAEQLLPALMRQVMQRCFSPL